jgi:salicylate hydroxylase
MLTTKYDDLHRLLYRLATSTGTKVVHGACVTQVSVDYGAQISHALLANGEVMNADIIIGADGHKSIVRDVVTKQNNIGKPSGMSVLT